MTKRAAQRVGAVLIGALASAMAVVSCPEGGVGGGVLESRTRPTHWLVNSEILDKRTRFSKCLEERPDGSVSRVISLAPLHYKDGGVWRDIDTRVVALNGGNSGEWGCLTNGLKCIFGADDHGTLRVSLIAGGDTVYLTPRCIAFGSARISLPGHRLLEANVLVDGSRIVFADSISPVGLAFTVTPDGLRADVRLGKDLLRSNAGASMAWVLEFTKGNGNHQAREDFLVQDPEGAVSISIGSQRRPLAIELSPPRLEDEDSHQVLLASSWGAAETRGGYEVAMKPMDVQRTAFDEEASVVLSAYLWLDPTDDAWISSGHPYENSGSSSYLIVGWDSYQMYYNFRTLLRFNIDAIPLGSAIEYACICLFVCDWEPSPSNLRVYTHRILDSWIEDYVTWDDGVPYSSYYSYIDVLSSEGERDWPVTQMVQEWVDGTFTNYGVMLKCSENFGYVFRRTFYSKENGGYGPYVFVQYTPPPPPDLIVDDVDFTPPDPVAGSPITVTVTIRNQGESAANGFFLTDFYEDLPGPPDPGQPGDYYFSRTYLGAGQTYTRQFDRYASSADIWHMYVQVDTDADIEEANENNNVYGPVDVFWAGKDSASASNEPWSGWWWPCYDDTWANLYDLPGPVWDYCQACSLMTLPWSWEYAYHRNTDPDSWYGHCDGWAKAAINEDEPAFPRGDFSIGDQKGLLAECWEDAWGDSSIQEIDPSPVLPGQFWEWLRQTIRDGLWGLHMTGVDLSTTGFSSYPVYRYKVDYRPTAEVSGDLICDGKIHIWFADYSLDPDGVGTVTTERWYSFSDVVVYPSGAPSGQQGSWTGNSSGNYWDYPDDCFLAASPTNGLPAYLNVENPYVDYYKVRSIISTGSCAVDTVSSVSVGRVPDVRISRNPVLQSTEIWVSIPEPAHVEVVLIDVNGRVVTRLLDEQVPGKRIACRWDCTGRDGSHVSCGLYFARVRIGDDIVTKKVLVLR